MENNRYPSNYDLQVDVGRHIFLEYDQKLLIRKFGLRADEYWIYLTYMNTSCRISRAEGRIDEQTDGQWKECRNYSTVMTIYDLLCHHKGETAPALFHQWCAIGAFAVTGVSDTGTFTKKAAAFFDGRTKALKEACGKLGGIHENRMAGADVTCRIPVTHFFPVLLRFWEGDDEFPPKLQLMWDRNAMSFLHFETTFFLQGDLLERLKEAMMKSAEDERCLESCCAAAACGKTAGRLKPPLPPQEDTPAAASPCASSLQIHKDR